MKIALVILGLGGNQPVTKQTGRLGGTYTFLFNREYGGHAIEYDLGQDGELERFNAEAKDILAQKLNWQFCVVLTQGRGPGAEGRGVGSDVEALLSKLEDSEKLCVEHSCTITELQAELEAAHRRGGAGDGPGYPKEAGEERLVTSSPTPEGIVALVKANIEEALNAGRSLEEALEAIKKDLESQGGEEASRRAHNSEAAGSSPAPGTTATESPNDSPAEQAGDTHAGIRPSAESEKGESGKGDGESGSESNEAPRHSGAATVGGAAAKGETPAMTVSEAAATLGNGVPEAEDSEAGKVLAEAKRDAGTGRHGEGEKSEAKPAATSKAGGKGKKSKAKGASA